MVCCPPSRILWQTVKIDFGVFDNLHHVTRESFVESWPFFIIVGVSNFSEVRPHCINNCISQVGVVNWPWHAPMTFLEWSNKSFACPPIMSVGKQLLWKFWSFLDRYHWNGRFMWKVEVFWPKLFVNFRSSWVLSESKMCIFGNVWPIIHPQNGQKWGLLFSTFDVEWPLQRYLSKTVLHRGWIQLWVGELAALARRMNMKNQYANILIQMDWLWWWQTMEKWRCSMFDKLHHVSVLFCFDLGHGDHLYVSTTVVSSPPFPLKAPSIPEISGGRNTVQTGETMDHYRRMDDGFRVFHVEKNISMF